MQRWFYFFFLISMSLLSFSCLIDQAKTWSIMLIWSGESRHPWLVAHLRGKTFSLITAHDVLCEFFIHGCFFFFMLSKFLFLMRWLFLYWKDVEPCQMLSLHQLTSCFFFLFHSVDIAYYVDQFTLLKHPCISAVNPSWLYYIILVMCCWILFASS